MLLSTTFKAPKKISISYDRSTHFRLVGADEIIATSTLSVAFYGFKLGFIQP
jgi:hypothetical protein